LFVTRSYIEAIKQKYRRNNLPKKHKYYDRNSRAEEYPIGWVLGNEDKNEKLSSLQCLCLEIFRKSNLTLRDKKAYYKLLDNDVKNGANLTMMHSSCECFKNTVLMEALSCEARNEWLASTLIDLAVKYNKKEVLFQKNGGWRERYSTPLIFAIKCGRSKELIKKLIKAIPHDEKNKNLDARDSKGNTALHYACLCGYNKIIKLLIKKGADTSVTNKRDGQTYTLKDYYEYKATKERWRVAAYEDKFNPMDSLVFDDSAFYARRFEKANKSKVIDKDIRSLLGNDLSAKQTQTFKPFK
jgi:hypothetical protein